MFSWLAQQAEPYFPKLENTGVVASLIFAPTPNASTEQMKQALMSVSQGIPAPYVMTPFLQTIGASEQLNPATVETAYLDMQVVNTLSSDSLKAVQTQLAFELQGKTAGEIQEIFRQKVDGICREVAQKYGIGLRDIEPYFNLHTGEVKILDFGMSIPLDHPSSSYMQYLQMLYGLTDEQLESLLTAHRQNRYPIDAFYERYPTIPRTD